MHEEPTHQAYQETLDGLTIASPDFLAEVGANALKWDREWCNYFQEPYANRFFISLQSPERRLWIETQELAKYSPRDFYYAKPFGEYSFETWTHGSDIVGKRVLELGCGPGAFGKAAAKVAAHYVGIDYSPLALHVARIVSPANTTYLHISQINEIEKLQSSIDTIVGRHFFIHQNAANVRWILELYRFLLKDRGKAVLDFWLHPLGSEIKGAIVRDGLGALSEDKASCVYYFAPETIKELTEEAGFIIDNETEVPEVDRRFVTITKR